MPEPRARLACQACGLEVSARDPLPFRCAASHTEDDIDHLLRVTWGVPPTVVGDGKDTNPFVAFRGLSYSYDRARVHGMSDEDYVSLVRELDSAVEAIDGTGFHTTPWEFSEELSVWLKDETGNVAGSHKARHLFGLALHIEVAERTGLVKSGSLGTVDRPFAIASCGNAALSAAIITRAWGRKLRVYIPTWADAGVVHQLREHGADIVTCERNASSPPGDPCFHAFRAAVEAGAVPFTCQGTENGLVIDGGMTLGFEIARAINSGAPEQLDHLFIQVGGGALASATIQGLGVALQASRRMPAIHAVQTRGSHPLLQAWKRLMKKLPEGGNAESNQQVIQEAALRRSRYMRPVPSPGSSIASGILDDETYDWFAIVNAMYATGGWPVIAEEEDLLSARELASASTGVRADATGSAGLGGVLAARRAGLLESDETIGVLLTGIQRPSVNS